MSAEELSKEIALPFEFEPVPIKEGKGIRENQLVALQGNRSIFPIFHIDSHMRGSAADTLTLCSSTTCTLMHEMKSSSMHCIQ